MSHVLSVGMKFVVIVASLWMFLIFGFTVLTPGEAVFISVVFTAVSYLGDLFIMPHINNIIASVTDTILAFLIIWILGMWVAGNSIGLVIGAIIVAVIAGLSELMLHRFIRSRMFDLA